MKAPWTSTSENAKHCKANRSCLLPPAPGAPPDTELPASISRRQLLDLFLFTLPPERRVYRRLRTDAASVLQRAPHVPLLANP